MSKVARSARVASRHRVETISADKTIATAETGETYLIDHNAASALTITMPALQDGAYFKFIFKTKLAANGTVVFNSATNTAGDFGGAIIEQTVHATDGAAAAVVSAAATNDIITLSDDINIGSYLECVCDGSTWFWTGHLIVDAPEKIAFSS